MSYKLQGQGPACFCSLELNALPPGLPLAPDPRKMAQICTPGRVKVGDHIWSLSISGQEGSVKAGRGGEAELCGHRLTGAAEGAHPGRPTRPARPAQVAAGRSVHTGGVPLAWAPGGQPSTRSSSYHLLHAYNVQAGRQVLDTDYLLSYESPLPGEDTEAHSFTA